MKLIDLRTKLNLTQQELATKIGKKQNVISMWERGKSRPKIDAVYRLAKALNCTQDDILSCFVAKGD